MADNEKQKRHGDTQTSNGLSPQRRNNCINQMTLDIDTIPLHVKITVLNELFGEINKFPATLEAACKRLEEYFEIKEYYMNPCREKYKIKGFISEIRKNFISFAINRLSDCKNLTIDKLKVTKHLNDTIGNDNFDAQIIYDFIKTNYLDKKEDLSFEEIAGGAVKFLPYIQTEDYRSRRPTIVETLQGNKIKLRCYITWSDYSVDMSYFYERAKKLEKFIKIILNDAKASTVTGRAITTAYWNIERTDEKQILRKRSISNSVIKSVKIYKNGRFDVEFYNKENALKVAKELIICAEARE